MTADSFYSVSELEELGLKACGRDVKISRKSSIYNPDQLRLGDHVRIDDFCILTGRVSIGSYVHVAAYAGLYGAQEIILEDFTGISARVTIYTESDDYVFGRCLTNPTVPAPYRVLLDAGPVTVRKHALIGCGSVILPLADVGEGASVGALSLVRGNLEPWSICRGNPARKIGQRPSQTILKLEAEFRAGGGDG